MQRAARTGSPRSSSTRRSHEGTIARITLNRPETRNAQHRPLLLELDEAFVRAEQDDTVRVVILSGAGKMFSSGHDMGTPEHRAERDPGPNQHITRRTNGGSRQGAEARMLQEWHYFFENTKRWRASAQDHDRPGARPGLRGRADADVGL